jgi:hypothetical protein
MVAMNVWPTDAADGAVTSEARWRKMGRLWAPSGPAAGVGGELKPSYLFPNLTVKNGAAWADGHYCELNADQVFGGLNAASVGLVVVRFDPTANTAELLYLDAATTPTQNPTGIWEVPIARLSGGVMTDARNMIIPVGTTPWYTPTLQNGFTQSTPPVQYRKVGDMVQLRGAMNGTTSYVAAFNLPAGFRPPGQITISGTAVTTGDYWNVCCFTITPGGDLSISSTGHKTPCPNFSFSTAT